MKLHLIDGLTQVGYAKQSPTVLVGAVCDYLDSLTLPANSVSFFLISPLLIRIVSEGWAGSSENSLNLHSIDGLTQVGYVSVSDPM